PGDLAITVDPVVGIRLAGESGDFALLVVGVVRQDLPVIVCNAGDFERHFCFGHAALCTESCRKRTRLAAEVWSIRFREWLEMRGGRRQKEAELPSNCGL